VLTSTLKPNGFLVRSPLTCITRLFSLVAAIFAILNPGMSNATVIGNAVTDFSSANPSGAWSYGYGITGTSFTAYNDFRTPCDAEAGSPTSCWQIAPGAANPVPLVGINNTGSTLDMFNGFSNVVLPTDVLWMHPGTTVDSIVRWTAPAAGNYDISGFFELLDDRPSGVIVRIYDNSTSEFVGALVGPGATPPSTPGEKDPFSFPLFLNANDVISFGVNNSGDVRFDSTGLAATISAVPEPGTLMLFGAGLLGLGFVWLQSNRMKRSRPLR